MSTTPTICPRNASLSTIHRRRAGCSGPGSRVRRAGTTRKRVTCASEVPGRLRSHREQIVRKLMAIYHPGCNEEHYEPAWKDEWIGEYHAPTTGPLTTGRDPSTGG